MILLDSVSKLKISIISGFLIGVAYQPWGLGFFTYFGFIPLIHLWTNNGPKINFKLGGVFGIAYNLISNYWIGMNSGTNSIVALLSLFFAVLYLSLFWSIAGYIIGFLNNKTNTFVGLPFVIVSLEWLRSFGPLGFPWGNIALTQTKYINLIQFVDIIGTYGVTFLVISINLIIYKAIYDRKRRKTLLSLVAILITGIMISGRSMINSIKPKKESIEVAVIQPNIDPNEKWNASNRIKTFSIARLAILSLIFSISTPFMLGSMRKPWSDFPTSSVGDNVSASGSPGPWLSSPSFSYVTSPSALWMCPSRRRFSTSFRTCKNN
mgnify:CR=1 FL=1